MKQNPKCCRKPLSSLVLPGSRKTLIAVKSIGNVVSHDNGVMLEHPDGEPLGWVDVPCEDPAVIDLIADELNKLVLARDAEKFYQPDFSFMSRSEPSTVDVT